MKIKFEVQIADGFSFPEPDGSTNLHLWPIPVGKSESLDVDISFDPTGKDNMKDAENALSVYMKKNYPNKEYKIYYWYWL